MSDIIKYDPTRSVTEDHAIHPLRKLPELADIKVRHATPGSMSDLAFIDSLQKMHAKAVGWMPTQQLEGHIAKGHVLIAESTMTGETPAPPDKVGYCIGVDKYFKREDVGIIYQMNITPGRQRGLVGATLLKAMFDGWPYGVRLCCCWCAQDLQANHFWEAMGFVPLAFRTGSRRNGPGKQGRVHIFWQKKIRKGDMGDATSGGWWYPSQTGAGAIKEDRIVLPIPPGVHWSDAKPRVLPGVANIFDQIAGERQAAQQAAVKQLEGPPLNREEKAKRKAERQAMLAMQSQHKTTMVTGGLRFGSSGSVPESDHTSGGEAKRAKREAKKAANEQVAKKNDPRLVAMARELRDRWLEQANAGGDSGGLGLLEGRGKYDVSRAIGMTADETTAPRTVVVTPPEAPEVALSEVAKVIPESRRLEAA